jgi:putative ABC transport system permease protein
MPPIVSIELDVFEFMDYRGWTTDLSPEAVSRAQINEIARLPQVDNFSYTIYSMLGSFDLRIFDPYDTRSFRLMPGWESFPEEFRLFGASSADILSVEQGIINIVRGRTFSESEMSPREANSPIAAVVSNEFAMVNGLDVGDTFTLYDMYRYAMSPDEQTRWLEGDTSVMRVQLDELFDYEAYSFEIVGLFEVASRMESVDLTNDDERADFNREVDTWNQIFIPSFAAAEINLNGRNALLRQIEEDEHMDSNNVNMNWLEREDEFLNPVFILHDPLYIEEFRETVTRMLPPYQKIIDLSGNFESISSAMVTMLWIADIVLVVSVVASILVLSLMITLTLGERKREIGVFLGLGAKKLNIVSQIVCEVMVIALLGITLSIFTGNLVGQIMSETMLHNELSREPEPAQSMGVYGLGAGHLAEMNFTREMSVDDMIAAFDSSLDIHTIATVYLFTTMTIFASTILPTTYILSLSPKMILLQSAQSGKG